MSTKKITTTAILLALAIASQFLKNISVYLTGPFINLVLIIATLSCGLVCGIALSVITPVTSFLITGSPIMSAMPLIIPCVMLGNAVICVCVAMFTRKSQDSKELAIGLVAGTVAKAVVMGLCISVGVIGVMGANTGLPEAALNTAKTTFSLTQLITAGIASVLAWIIWPRIKQVWDK